LACNFGSEIGFLMVAIAGFPTNCQISLPLSRLQFQRTVNTMRIQTAICFCSLSLAFGLVLVDTTVAQRQRFDVEAYLKKIDADSNGVLDEKEMSGRTKSFIERMGFDTNRPVKVRDIISKVKEGRKEWEDRKAKENAPALKVPGFGLTQATDNKGQGVPGFGLTESSGSSRIEKFSEDTQERVNDVLRRYDKNKDGILDKEEIGAARWGSPKPEDSDTNRDGKLSRTELAMRYVKREQYYDKNGGGDRRRGRDRDDRDSKERSALARTEAIRLGGSSGSSRRSSGSSSGRSAPSSSRSRRSSGSSSADRAKYVSYAEQLIKRYDENKSGALDKDEIAKMNNAPKADANNDGKITKEELVDNWMKGSASSSTSSSSKRASSDSETGSKPSSSRSRSSSRGRSGGSSSFEKLDANTDARIHMHEFSDEWDEEKVKAFYEKDKNGDGVITLEEWRDS
jgi:Ca2+-binding EF-hand superfamily protein